MKIPRIANAMGYIDDDLITTVERKKQVKHNPWLKCGSFIASFAVLLIVAAVIVPMLSDNGNITSSTDNGNVTTSVDNEYAYEKGYFYNVTDGVFSTYVGGKVISEDKIGNKIADVSITAGWKNSKNEWLSTETLRGEVYSINSISSKTAVALKFIDKGEAVTTTHYYVIMNPNADLTAVKDYIIAPVTPNNPGNEIAGDDIIFDS